MRSFILEPQQIERKIVRYELTAGTAQDVYEKNYSTVKSGYGLDHLGDGTFTGDVLVDSDGSPVEVFYTDTGEVIVDEWRYRDTIASVLLVSIDTYGATISTGPIETSPEWQEVESGDYLSRWIKSDINATVTLEIGPSLVSGQIEETQLLANNFPEWMEIRSSTTSNGFKLLNVLALDIEDLKFQAIAFRQRGFINSIPTGIKSFAYLSELESTEYPIDVIGEYDESPAVFLQLSAAESLREFIEAESTKHLYYLEGRYLFTSGEYDTLTVDSAEYPQEKIHIVNDFDHIGNYLSLPRFPDEENSDYKVRILDVFVNPPGASNERIQAAVERDCGCNVSNVWELTSGNVPWEEANDPGVSGVFYTEETEEHRELARWCRENGKVGFDDFLWGEAMFDLYPHPWDLAEMPYLLDYSLNTDESPALIPDSGIGYGDDLLAKPYEHAGSFPYSITVSAQGWLDGTETVYPAVEVHGRVVPSATQSLYDNSYEGYVCLEITSGGSVYCANYDVFIPEDRLNAINTNTYTFPVINISLSMGIAGALKTDTSGLMVNLPATDITKYELKDGMWDWETQALIPNTEADELTMGFDDELTINPWTVDSPIDHPEAIYVEHQTSHSSTDTSWVGDGTPFSLGCNLNNSELYGEIDVPSNLELVVGAGTVTYTLEIDSFSPEECVFSGTGQNCTLEFRDDGVAAGDNVVGWPPSDFTIRLSSSLQKSVDKITQYNHTSSVVLSGSVTPDSPVAIETIDVSSLSLPASFVNGKYTTKVSGDVFIRFDPIVTGEDTTIAVELNPVYMFEWAPKVKPGTLYIGGEEYFLHADSNTESVTGTSYTLVEPIAPGTVISLSEPLIETHFTDQYGVPTLTITQEVQGNGTRYLPIWYDNAVNITVESVSKSLLNTNIVDNVSVTNSDLLYTVAYQVTDSYCVDYANYVDGQFLPEITLQAAHGGLTVTYTPYNEEGYWVDTDVPTNPLFTIKNRDFLYLDGDTPPLDSVVLFKEWKTLYNTVSNTISAQVIDTDGNGVPGVVVHFTSDNGETLANGTTNIDGWAYSLLTIDDTAPAPSTIAVSAHVGDSPAITDSFTFNAVYESDYSFAAITLISQAYETCKASDNVQQSIQLMVTASDGTISASTDGEYDVRCDDGTSLIGDIDTDTNGVATLTYTPTEVGRYVATFTFGSLSKEIGWSIVERL